MSDYTQAPATKMVATHCSACGRPLVDANSLAAGMGPDCRVRYGVPEELSEAERAEANQLIYHIAREQTGPEVTNRLGRLRELGLVALADRITKRLAPEYSAVIFQEDGQVAVKAAYDPTLVGRFRRVPGRRWDKSRKLTTFPDSSKRALWTVLREAFPGGRCLGPKGEFTL